MALRDDVILRFGGDSRGVNQTLGNIRKSVSDMSSSIRSALSLFGGIYVAKQFSDMSMAIASAADNAKRLHIQLGRVGGDGGFGAVADLAADLGVRINNAAESVNFFAPTFAKLGMSFKDTISFVSDLTRSLRVYGIGAVKASAITTQLSDAFNSGTLGGDELKSLSENAGGLYSALEKAIQEMLKTDTSLKKLGSTGQITSDVLYKAFQTAFSSIRGDIEGLPDTMEQQQARMENSWTILMAAIDKSLHQSDMWKWVTGRLSGFASRLSAELGSVDLPTKDLEAQLDVLRDRIKSDTAQGITEFVQDMARAAGAIQEELIKRQKGSGETAPGTKGAKTAGPSDEFKKSLEDRKKLTMTAAEAEAAIWREYSKEVNAATTDAAVDAQKKQEAAFKALAKAGASDTLLKYYENLIGQIGDKPIKAKMEIAVDRTEIDKIPAWMKASLEGQGYTIAVGVIPQLLMGENGEGGLPLTPGQSGDVLSGEVDKTGANP